MKILIIKKGTENWKQKGYKFCCWKKIKYTILNDYTLYETTVRTK